MRKLTILFALLTLGVGLWAEQVSYLYPVYIDNDPTKGIASWQTGSADATEITNATTALNAGWYVVRGADVQTGTLVCNGAVHLILADGAKLTATGVQESDISSGTPGIQVSGDGNSLSIYVQSTALTTMGQLIATGKRRAAGIGGGDEGSGSNITINGGEVTANGGNAAAGIGGGTGGNGSNITINGGEVTATGGDNAACIGGGNNGSGSNITINGGKVTATGKVYAAGIGGGGNGNGSYITINGGEVTANSGTNHNSAIGGGYKGSGSNIFVATNLILKADGNNPPTTVIENDGTDLASKLNGNQHVTIVVNLAPARTNAIAEIDEAINGITDTNIIAIATTAKTDINAATTVAAVTSIKDKALADIALAKAKTAAIAAINAAIKGLTLFDAEESYIDFIKSSIQQGDDVNLVQADKQLGLDYIALHDDKVASIAEVRHDMGDYAESEAIYNFIGGPAIEGAVDADKITEAKIAALAKLEEYSQILGDAATVGYNKGKEDGIEEAQAALPTDAQDAAGAVVIITKGDKTLKLVNPDKVTYGKQE